VIGALLHPEDAVVVGVAGEEIGKAVFVDVDDVDEARLTEIELLVKLPIGRARIGRYAGVRLA